VQAFQQWQQSPTQGMIPSVSSDSDHLSNIQDKLLEVVENLTFSHHYLESTGLSKRYSALFTAVCDALNSATEAIERCDDQPDE